MMMRKLSFIWSNDQIWHKKAKNCDECFYITFTWDVILITHLTFILSNIFHISQMQAEILFFLPIFNHSARMLIPSKCLMIHINNKPILLSFLIAFCCVDVVFDVNCLLYILVIVVYEYTFTLFLIIIETILISHCCGFLFTVF